MKYLKRLLTGQIRIGWIIGLWRKVPYKQRWAITYMWWRVTGQWRCKMREQQELGSALQELDRVWLSATGERFVR